MTDTTVADQGQGAPPQPVRPENREPVSPAPVRTDLAEARRQAELTPQQRFEQRDGPTQRERIGDRKLSDAEVSKLTMAERYAYAERQTELAKAGKSGADSKEGDTPAPDAATETKHRFGDIELTDSEIKGLLERKGLEDIRKATLPADATKYELKLPESFQIPQGVEIKFNEQDPAMADFRAWAHREGLDQRQFSDALAIHTAMKVREQTTLRQARDAEVAKLGATASQQVTAVTTFLRAHLGSELARPFELTLVMANQVKGWQMIINKLTNQGSGSFSPARSPHEPARMSEERWNSMSYSEKKEYSANASYGNNGRR